VVMLSLVTMALGKLFGMGETWVEAKQERETAKVKNQIAVEQAKTQATITIKHKDAEACNDIDLITVKNKNNTLMDNLVVCTILSPFWCMFIPPLQPYVESGFKAFSAAPEWYQWCVYAVVISELGLRRIFMKLFETISIMRTGEKKNG
jgi:hypothetical protein